MNDIVAHPPARARRQLTRADILPLDEYVKVRAQRRRETTELKRRRRVEVGPFATFYFENFATMWQQVQEMLYIEKGGDEQLTDELEAYNPLIPQGDELVATVMFEVEDPGRRLRRIAGVPSNLLGAGATTLAAGLGWYLDRRLRATGVVRA